MRIIGVDKAATFVYLWKILFQNNKISQIINLRPKNIDVLRYIYSFLQRMENWQNLGMLQQRSFLKDIGEVEKIVMPLLDLRLTNVIQKNLLISKANYETRVPLTLSFSITSFCWVSFKSNAVMHNKPES